MDKNRQTPPGLDIDCVIIGVNAQSTLARCIESVLGSRYDRGKVYIYYVDGGSSDHSVALARQYHQVRVIELEPGYPTPGRGRNAGWKAGSSPLVQFLDSDTVMDPDWLDKAVDAMREDVGAVRGNRIELHPEASRFNWIGNLEWNAPPGDCDAFGGDVLIRREVLEKTGGYDEELVAGEDPELSQRVRKEGWRIIQLNEPMTYHDLAMTTLHQYWKRAFRTGYGYAAVTLRHAKDTRGFWLYECFRIIARGGGFISLFLLGLFGALWHWNSLVLWIPATMLLLFPRLFRISYFMSAKNLTKEEAKIYAWHCSLVVIPEFFGILRFLSGKVSGKPLRNKPTGLRTMVTRNQSY